MFLINIKLTVTEKGKNIFTSRECQVLIGIADGGMDKQIARGLNISVSAVKAYHNRINEKLQLTEQSINTRSAMVTSAIAHGLLNVSIKD